VDLILYPPTIPGAAEKRWLREADTTINLGMLNVLRKRVLKYTYNNGHPNT